MYQYIYTRIYISCDIYTRIYIYQAINRYSTYIYINIPGFIYNRYIYQVYIPGQIYTRIYINIRGRTYQDTYTRIYIPRYIFIFGGFSPIKNTLDPLRDGINLSIKVPKGALFWHSTVRLYGCRSTALIWY